LFSGRRSCPSQKNAVPSQDLPPSLLKLLGDQGWVALAFLLSEFDELNGLTPLEVLRRRDRTLRAQMERLARIASGDDIG
jgi:hypothetical protein